MKTLIVIFINACFIFSIYLQANQDTNITDNLKLLQIKTSDLVNKGMYDEAIMMIEKGIEKYPNNDFLFSLLGRSYKGIKNIDKAELYFQKALSINPNNEFALAYMEETKKTKDLLKNDTQEKIYTFLEDKGIDLLFIFLGFLAGEIIATLILRCDKENWKLLIYKIKLKQEQKLYILNPKYLIKIGYKYIFGSACPLKTILIYFTFLTTLVLIFLVYEVITEDDLLLNVKTNQDFWKHIAEISIYCTLILIILWVTKIIISHKNQTEVELKLLKLLHNMYKDEDIIELNNLIEAISDIYDKNHFEHYITQYIINREEISFLLSKLNRT